MRRWSCGRLRGTEDERCKVREDWRGLERLEWLGIVLIVL